MNSDIEISDTFEVEKRKREIQILINVIEPDPEYQPFFISDEASFYDITGKSKEEIEQNLRFYFKGELPVTINTPIWQFVDVVKIRYPGWPDNWPPEH
ncbi:hypothetical protein [Microbulbifer sp.]|uniref:hypothetical protein n=1 Tax=Microbulbifer sp. TaxID=1908541 RepID=UPI003F393777